MCEDFNAREQEIGDPQTLTDLVEKGTQIVDAFEEAIAAKVHELRAPEEIAEQADRLVEIAGRQRRVLGDLVAAAGAGDVARVRELASENGALNEESSSIARALGAEACASYE